MANGISKLPQGQIDPLTKKILFTFGFLAIYRIGVQIPIPGVDSGALSEFFRSQGGNLLGMFNMFSGGALERFSIFALGVMPYISASIISQLLTVLVPQVEALSKEGESGRRKITQYTRYATIVLALIQGFVIANSLQNNVLGSSTDLVSDTSALWPFLTAISLTAGTAFVMWLGEQITERGIGNGISLIIFCGIVAGLPGVVANTYTQYTDQDLELFKVIALIAICIMVVAGVVFIEQGARQVPVQYAKRQVGRRVFGGQTSHLPIRVNSASVIPPIFAGSLLQFPVTLVSVAPNWEISKFIGSVMNPGGWLYNTIYCILIIFFAFFYTSIVFKPDDIAENLKKNGGFIPGIRPGARTAEYLSGILNRLTLSGSIYLAAICVFPTVLTERFNVQFYFGGTSLLIVVGVALETFRQIEAQLQSQRYDSFLKKGVAIRPRGGGGI